MFSNDDESFRKLFHRDVSDYFCRSTAESRNMKAIGSIIKILPSKAAY